MQCSYQIHDLVMTNEDCKARFCPSEAHAALGSKGSKEITFYCSHHQLVVIAKETNDQSRKEIHGDI